MKQVLVFVLAALAATPALAQAPAAPSPADKELISHERAVIDAVVKKDMKAFKSMLAPEAIAVEGSGVAKGPLLDAIISQQQITSSSLENLQVHWIDANTAVVTSKWTGKGTFMGQALPSPTIASTVWVKRGGKWLAAFHQESPFVQMAMPAAPPAKK